jgi:hypothetical protein
MKRFLASLSWVLLLSGFAFSQTGTSYSTGPNGPHGSMHFQAPFYRSVITGAPYSAERVDEHVQTLADGTHINETYPETKFYRDSMGRTREERPVFRGPIERHADAAKGPLVVEINDPVARVRYIFIVGETVAHRQELPEGPQHPNSRVQTGQPIGGVAGGVISVAGDIPETAPPPSPVAHKAAVSARQAADDPNRPHTTQEDLGTEVIEGIQAEGHRITTTWPVGSMGNDRPITNTHESWRSPELKEIILSKTDDPRTGEQTNKLVNINRSEPDASLFEPPTGFTVKDETGEFTIEWGTQR